MIYIIRNGETFLDAVLNGSGSIDNYEEILNANNFTDWTPAVSVGQQIVIPDDIVRQQNVLSVLNKYPANNNYAAADFMIQVLALINKANPVSDQLIDKDGNIYTTIDIGTLRIIVQNFKCTKYADGSDIPNITDNSAWAADSLGAQCSYNNDSGNKDIYGLLYNWFSINNVKGLAYLEKNGIQDLDWRVWSGRIEIKEGHKLLTTGPYGITRHPIYTGLLFGILGTVLIYNQSKGILALFLVFCAFLFKINKEEKFLLKQFTEYETYMKKVKRVIPFVY